MIRMILALVCWITALIVLLSLRLNGFDWRYLLTAITGWLLAYLLWRRQQAPSHKRPYSPENTINGWDIIEILDVIFWLIEGPIRAIIGLIHILAHL